MGKERFSWSFAGERRLKGIDGAVAGLQGAGRGRGERGVRGPRVGLVLGAGGIMGGAWLTGALDAIASESGWDPGIRRLHRRHVGRLDDGGAPGRGCAALVHGGPLRRSQLRGASGRGRASGGGGRQGGRRRVPPPARSPATRAGLAAAGRQNARCALAPHPGDRRRGLAPPRRDLDRAAEGHRPAGHAVRLVGSPEPVGGGLRLRDGEPGGLRAARLPQGGARRRGGRVVRHPGLLLPGRDRRSPLRRRRDPLDIQPRHVARAGPGLGDLPEPHVLTPSAASLEPRRDSGGARQP